jgi:thiamine biosynthesis lipoprotein
MGSVFEILLLSRHRSFVEFGSQALDEVRRLEKLMTVYDENSQLNHVNRWAFIEPVAISPELFDVLKLSVDIYRKTDGAFDITSGLLSKVWGFHQRRGCLPEQDRLAEALARIGSNRIKLDPYKKTITCYREGVSLFLGSIGKGFALDRAGLILQNAGLEAALIHAGFSSFLAFGDSGGSNTDTGWKVSVRHPANSDEELLSLRLRNQALATSGTSEQYFELHGRRYGHIIDPRTGFPTDHHLSTTALAPTAAMADALSTAFFVMSTNQVREFCEARDDIGAIVVPKPTNGDSVEKILLGTAETAVD